MAKKDLRAQMDAARAAAAFIDAAHDELESSREMRGEGADGTRQLIQNNQ